MDYISVKAASEKWGISERRIQKLCEENRIDGTEKFGRAWMIRFCCKVLNLLSNKVE
ncbi:DNA-binding protein [Enterococcus faecalis]|nr:DNA-binding protein [Enterococcus faecalis]